MKDSEKAHEISWETSKHYDPNCCKQEWCEMAARDMASWKEQQMIEKAVDWLNNNIGAYLDYEAPKYGCSVEIDKVSLIEDFKKAMEEQL